MDAIRAFVQTLLPFEFLQFDFMVNALLAILLLTPLLGLLGTMAVNQQMAFFSDALGHSALTGIGLGILLGVSSDLLAMLVFGIVWALAAVAITLTAIDLKKFRVFSMICYMGMGWCIIFAVVPTYHALGLGGFLLLVAGGLLYTFGAILYGLGINHRYMHSVFHIFVILGSLAHFFCIVLYVL